MKTFLKVVLTLTVPLWGVPAVVLLATFLAFTSWYEAMSELFDR